jgi:hypothetical protein
MEEQKKLRDKNESDYQLTFISPGTGQRKSAGGFFYMRPHQVQKILSRS